MNKQESIQYLRDIMATIAAAYYKGRGGSVLDALRVHETDEAGISIDLYNFEGDGQPVCEGLDFDALCPADMQMIHQRAHTVSYEPDWEEHPVLLLCSDTTGNDDSFDLTLDNVPQEVIETITNWITSKFPK